MPDQPKLELLLTMRPKWRIAIFPIILTPFTILTSEQLSFGAIADWAVALGISLALIPIHDLCAILFFRIISSNRAWAIWPIAFTIIAGTILARKVAASWGIPLDYLPSALIGGIVGSASGVAYLARKHARTAANPSLERTALSGGRSNP